MKQSDKILVFTNGRLVETDTYDKLVSQRKSAMYDILMSDSSGSSNFFGKILEGLRIKPKTHFEIKEIPPIKYRSSVMHSLKNGDLANPEEVIDQVVEDWIDKAVDRKNGKLLLDEEEKVLNNVDTSLKRLLLARGIRQPLFIFFVFFITDFSVIWIQLWMALWGVDIFDLGYDRNYYVFVITVAIVCLLVISRECVFTSFMLKNLTFNYK